MSLMEDFKYKVSIIIPMYDAEKYIENCLKSILKSNLSKKDYEIIIINDGSTDNGPVVAQQYAKEFDNILYPTQYNQGQSVARNYGITESRGKYIWCVDADDMVDGDFTDILATLHDFPEIDIIAFEAKELNNDRQKVICVQANVSHNQIISGRDAVISGYNPSAVWAL